MCFGFRKHYSPGYGEVMYGGKQTGLKNLLVIFDSGSSYTYLSSQAYEGLLYLVSFHKYNKNIFLKSCMVDMLKTGTQPIYLFI